jgi:hypothetical protein
VNLALRSTLRSFRRRHAWAAWAAWSTLAAACLAQPPSWTIASAELGFGDAFKLGCWTQLTVGVDGGGEPLAALLEAELTDADGVAAVFRSDPGRPIGLTPGAPTETSLLVRVGQQNSPLVVRLRTPEGRIVAERTFPFGYERTAAALPYGLPATTRVMLALGVAPALEEIVRSEASEVIEGGTRTAQLTDPRQLPLSWLGYEGVDTLVIAAREVDFFRSLPPDSPRIAALIAWVEQGGRIVLSGGAASEETLGPSGALAGLAPGRFDGLVPLRDRDAAPIETFSGSNDPLGRGRVDLRVVRLADVRGDILAHAGGAPADLPLVVRQRRGLGQVTFTAFDFTAAPLDRWSGRQPLLRRLVGWPLVAPGPGTGPPLQSGHGDLVNQLRAGLDSQFVGVQAVPFGLVALLAAIYIALIGPGDYFLVRRVLKRMEATWITFPLIAALTSVFAYWLAGRLKGDQLRVNQVEIVDFDVDRQTARGTVWTHFFSPRVTRYRLALEPRVAGVAVAEPQAAVAWLGEPGAGLGGLQGQGGQGWLRRGYEFSPALDEMLGVPVAEWSTKTITARWTASTGTLVDADLRQVRDELLAGSVANRTGVELRDCLLLYGKWAYRLTTLADGEVRTVDESLQPRTVKTLLTNAAAGDEADVRTAADGTVVFDPYGHDIPRLAKAMMFYDAVGGIDYASTAQRYQAFVDLSYLLGGRQAILLARAPESSASAWRTADAELASSGDRRWTYYRFVLPVEQPHEEP